MVNMIREKEENKQKILLTTMIGVISTITFVTLLLVVCFYTDVIILPIKIVLMMIAISVFGVGLYVAMWGDRKIGYFKCRNCNELFTPTFMQYNMGMHLLSTRYLKCPHCKTRTWCKKVMTKECWSNHIDMVWQQQVAFHNMDLSVWYGYGDNMKWPHNCRFVDLPVKYYLNE